MSVLRYPTQAVAGDLLRGTVGCLLVGVPLAATTPPAWLAATLLLCLGLFLVFTASGCVRALSRYRLDAQGVQRQPAGVSIRWHELDALELSYYSTRRDGREGWLQLRLRAGSRVLRMDSRLAGFDQVLGRALDAARRRELPLGPATRANLEALGLDPGEAQG